MLRIMPGQVRYVCYNWSVRWHALTSNSKNTKFTSCAVFGSGLIYSVSKVSFQPVFINDFQIRRCHEMADRATENFMDYVSRTSDKEVLKVSFEVFHNRSLSVLCC